MSGRILVEGCPVPETQAASAQHDGRRFLNEVESKHLLASWGVPVEEAIAVASAGEAAGAARRLGFPVALKVLSPDVVHKSDVGGVKLGLVNEAEVEAAYAAIVSEVARNEPAARLDGVSVQRMAQPGTEVIVGMSRDPQFGPLLMFGLGGVFVEVLEDVSFRLAPIERRDAREMIAEIKGRPLLAGFRGLPPVDTDALEDLLLKVSEFIAGNPDVAELDLNPVRAGVDGQPVVLDARARSAPQPATSVHDDVRALDEPPGRRAEPHDHG
ncbi:MAG: acetyl-CoA synthetase [Dehalococcoidia bacterium]|nr:acetyl-CoA synthetase [Dehalococcoidia bacterium]